MENENEINYLIENPYFKILYPYQNYEQSVEYQRWKKSLNEKIGKNGIEMFCKKDKIVTFIDVKKELKCPICEQKYYLCSYCRKAEKKKTCCIKGYIKSILDNESLYDYINIQDKYNRDYFIEEFCLMFIPLISNMSIYLDIFSLFYLGLINKDVNYEERISSQIIYFFHKFLIVTFIFLMALIYMILYYICILTIIIISLPFDLYPIRIFIRFLELINE